MNVKVKHGANWWEEGLLLDELIKKFAERCGLEPLRYNDDPRHVHLEFYGDTKKRVTDFVSRIKKSKNLSGQKITITVEYDL